MIKTYNDKRTAALHVGKPIKGIPSDVARRAHAKLVMIDHAAALDDLRVPPANNLEALRGDRTGQHSVRVNKQWRICFVWRDGNVYDVEFCDYH